MKAIRKIAALASVSIIASAMSVASHASIAVYQNGVDITSSLPISASFSGQTTLIRSGFPNLNCTLTLGGELDIVGGDAVVSVTSANVSGFLCGVVTLSNFPWVSDPQSAADGQPISDIADQTANVVTQGVTFNDVVVNLCNSGNPTTVTASYDNRDDGTNTLNSVGSTFTFNSAAIGSNCTVNGTLTVVGDDIDIVDSSR